MNLKSLVPLLLSLSTATAFAHSNHDDEAPQPPVQQEVKKESKAPAKKPKDSHDAAGKKDKAAAKTPASPAAAAPKKTP